MRVAFTGHRPEQLNIQGNELSKSEPVLREAILREVRALENAGADTFLCGAAKGADIICGEIILAEKKNTTLQLQLICAIPFREQAKKWSSEWKLRYRELLKGADS
ncbi:MAG: SLOG family protein, partial [bacterium]